jgi:hypothetical protein
MRLAGPGLNDDQLLEALRQAVAARDAVPAEFIAAAQTAFAWHNIDAELAQLTYDSMRDAEPALSTRTEAASIRALTFTSGHLTIELEVGTESLVGQIVPAQSGVITIQLMTGAETDAQADEIGCFSIAPIPVGQFRLRCRSGAGVETVTGWITL